MARISKAPAVRRQEIIDTALTLFQEKGYENTTIQDIAVRMNVAQGLCYRYFKSKQEIFAVVSDYYADSFVSHINEPMADSSNIVDKFNLSVIRLIQYGIKHKEFESSFKDEPEISSIRLNRVTSKFIEIMIPIVEQGAAEGIFQCDNVPVTVKFISYGFINAIHADMPKENTERHIRSYIKSMIEICKRVLITNHPDIGKGWNDI